MSHVPMFQVFEFYNHLILSGTKMVAIATQIACMFYNHLILSGTKIGIVIDN